MKFSSAIQSQANDHKLADNLCFLRPRELAFVVKSSSFRLKKASAHPETSVSSFVLLDLNQQVIRAGHELWTNLYHLGVRSKQPHHPSHKPHVPRAQYSPNDKCSYFQIEILSRLAVMAERGNEYPEMVRMQAERGLIWSTSQKTKYHEPHRHVMYALLADSLR